MYYLCPKMIKTNYIKLLYRRAIDSQLHTLPILVLGREAQRANEKARTPPQKIEI